MPTDTDERYDAHGRRVFDKDPSATLDYNFDWTDWLDFVGDSLDTFEITIEGDSGVTLHEEPTRTLGVVECWLSGGALYTTAYVTCSIVTRNNPPRREDRTIVINIVPR